MPYLAECYEWHLIQTLKSCLAERKAYHNPGGTIAARHVSRREDQFFEIELRQVFLSSDAGLELPNDVFEQCQLKLARLCATLNRLVRPQLSLSEEGINETKYPLLWGLVCFLRGLPERRTQRTFDLVCGPHETVFLLPEDIDTVKEEMKVFTDWNDYFYNIFSTPPPVPERPSVHNDSREGQEAWSDMSLRNHVLKTFNSIFEHVTCGGDHHKAMIKLSKESSMSGPASNLHLLLHHCSTGEEWVEALCDTEYSEETYKIHQVGSFCSELRTSVVQGIKMRLLVQQHRLFQAMSEQPTMSRRFSANDRKSLGGLIDDGVFLPRDASYCFGKQTTNRYTLQQKRALAVQLGYCLMNFFDYYLSPSEVNFFHPSGPGSTQDDGPYLLFSSSKPPSALFRDFQLGHPVLLSFAKILLEVDSGKAIDLKLSLQHAENAQGWFEITRCVDGLEKERQDSYLDAIRGCLTVHGEISRSLQESDDSHDNDSDLRIRLNIYQHIVRNLERALKEYTPRPRNKRARSESPPSGPSSKVSSDRRRIRGYADFRSRGRESHEGRDFDSASRLVENAVSRPSQMMSHGTHDARDDQGPDTAHHFEEKRAKSKVGTAVPVRNANPHGSVRKPGNRDEFEIALLCALPLEYNAVVYALDEIWDRDGDVYGRSVGDNNTYTTGYLGKHNVVVVVHPHMGKGIAASVAANLGSSFPNVKLSLLVGICGGIPQGAKREMILGDVVISKTIVQYDFGRQYADRFVRKPTITDGLGHPNKNVQSLVITFETDFVVDWLEERTAYHLKELQAVVDRTKRRGKYKYPGASEDKLFQPTYLHKHREHQPPCTCAESTSDPESACDVALVSTCENLGCSSELLVKRARLQELADSRHGDQAEEWQLSLHVGAIGSGDNVMKSSKHRDELARKEGVIALEMEGAGIWNELPCIIVKGVCDYADSHKNKGWQDFAAATAASAAKAILERYTRTDRY